MCRPSPAGTIASQGLIQSSASPTDAAIAGAGFFVVNASADASGEQLYTRAGSFSPDALGNLRTTSGHYLQGWLLDASGNPVDPNSIETVNVRNVNGIAVATTEVRVGANLDADQAPPVAAYAAGDLATYAQSGGASGTQPQFSRQIQVFDSLGQVARPHARLRARSRGQHAGTPSSTAIRASSGSRPTAPTA